MSGPRLAKGDEIAVLPSRKRSRIAAIVTADGELDQAVAGQAVTLTLASEVDISRGDVIVRASDALRAHDGVTARLLWMDEEPLAMSRQYLVKLGTAVANASFGRLHHAIDIHSYAPKPLDVLRMNEIGVVRLIFDKPLVATDYAKDRELGGFILIDRMTNQTVAIGLVDGAAAPPPEVSVSVAPAGPGRAVPLLHRPLARAFGVPNSRRRLHVYRNLTRDIVEQAVLWGAVLALTGSFLIAFAVTLVGVVSRPIVRALLEIAWRHLPARPAAKSELEIGV